MARPHIQVILAADQIPASLQNALRRTAATAGFWPLSEALREGAPLNADAVVVVVPDEPGTLASPLRVLFDRLAEHPRATLVLSASGQPVPPLNHPPMLPVTTFAGQDAHDLAGRLTTLVQMRGSLDSLHRGLLDSRRTGESIAQRYANQLRLASQVQREFLPTRLPQFGGVSFQAVFCPVDYVSGDIYDVHQLDEQHVGIALADATGHGMPAALLTVYIKRALRGKEIENGAYRILPPNEVLLRLNEDILDAALSECPFVAAIYAVLNLETREVTFARGGAPYPLLRKADGALQVLASEGSVVGVLPNSRFELLRVQLEPGDSLLFYSDGLERIVAPSASLREAPQELALAAQAVEHADDELLRRGADDSGVWLPEHTGDGHAGAEAAVATLTTSAARGLTTGRPCGVDDDSAHDMITRSPWCDTLRTQGTGPALEQVAGRQRALRRMGYPLDDLTVLALQIAN